MKKLLFSALLLAGASGATAQLADGTFCPNFTGTDLNGNSHTLYDYLDNGYTVVIDVSATWCGPCWSFHQSGVLEDIWVDHGPAGETGVSASTTDDVMVLWIEGDASTNTDCLYNLSGCNSSSQGDWVTGTDFPIIDDASIASTLGIAYFPTVYTVYPDRYLEESGQGGTTYANITSNIASHSGSSGDDASIFSYTGETAACGSVDVSVIVQNKGTNTIPSGTTVTVMNGATTLGTGTTTADLTNQFDTEEVTISGVAITAATTLDISVAVSGDVNTANDALSQAISLAEHGNGDLTLTLTLDDYPDETSWEWRTGGGTLITSGGSYTTANSTVTVTLPVGSSDCYELILFDDYGDGMNSAQWGGTDGSWELTDMYSTVLESETADANGEFGDEYHVKFDMAVATSVEENAVANMNVYPNPFSTSATISFENESAVDTEIKVTNAVGQIIVNEYLGEVTGTQTYVLDANQLEAGIYMVTVKAGEKSTTKRVVLNK